MKITEKIEKTLTQLPLKPGVYIMKNRVGEIIYIGKSRSLKKRVRSYFAKDHKDVKTGVLVAAIESIEFIVTNNEIEALILENNLIKKHKPRYNIMLKDSKTHPYIRITMKEPYPRLEKVRKVSFRDGNLYFGPFPNEYDLNRIVERLSRNFKLCTSKKRSIKTKSGITRPCLKYHLGVCQGVCQKKVSPENYRESIDAVIEVLSGKKKPDFKELEEQLKILMEEYRYEEAAELRDTIAALKRFFEIQKVEFVKPVNSDFWGISEAPDRVVYSIFFIRSGKLLGNRLLDVDREPGATSEEQFNTVLTRFYDNNLIPSNIYASILPDGPEVLEATFKLKAEKNISFKVPQKGDYKRLLQMADTNALEIMKNLKAQGNERVDEAVLDLEKELELSQTPYRIECVDISHIQGTDPVASLVVFENGAPKKGEYRLFHIKEAHGGDDPASIAEVTRRRFTRVLNEGSRICDLYIVDGGITQVRAAVRELEKLGLDVPILGLAKREETLVYPDGKEVNLPFSSKGMRMIIKLRNEAHRFANSFQKKTHSKTIIRSALLKLPGVGPATLKKIIWKYGSVDEIIDMEPAKLGKETGIPVKTAELILRSLKAGRSK